MKKFKRFVAKLLAVGLACGSNVSVFETAFALESKKRKFKIQKEKSWVQKHPNLTFLGSTAALSLMLYKFYRWVHPHFESCKEKISSEFYEDMKNRVLSGLDDVNKIYDDGEVPLAYAIGFKDDDFASKLIDMGADLKLADKPNRTILQMAFVCSSCEVIEKLLDKHAALDSVFSNSHIEFAVLAERPDVVALLLQKGFRLPHDSIKGLLSDVIVNGKTKGIEALLQLDSLTQDDYEYASKVAAEHNKPDIVNLLRSTDKFTGLGKTKDKNLE